ncbi:MAG: hypothetical protein H7068_11030 [Pedobacter sp.]|nr:hypothetical protein [Chitinophagaceae bacterium]
MKKIFFAVAILFVTTSSQAQLGDVLNKATSIATAAGFDTNKLTAGIMSKLTSRLSLTKEQNPKVTSAISTFLAAKSKIMPLLQSNKIEYAQKQTSLLSNLKTKLTGILLQNQMNKFLGLKPTSNTPTNILSQLFY